MLLTRLTEIELCFYKSLLLKTDDFQNQVIDLNYLEEQTMIEKYKLVEPLKFLFKNKMISFQNEELKVNYIRAYQARRKEYEEKHNKIKIASAMVGGGGSRGSVYNPQKREDWKTYYADEYCDLGKDIFEKLEQEGKVDLKIDEDILDKGKPLQDVEPILYFKFQLQIDSNKLKQFLDDYADSFASNQFNAGDKFSYSKQVIEISSAIYKLVDAGYPKESLSIDVAQICPRNRVEIRPTDGRQIAAIVLYDFVETVLAMEKEGFFTILDIQYQVELNRQIAASSYRWTDPVKIKIALGKDFHPLSAKYLSPHEYEEAMDLRQKLADAKEKTKALGSNVPTNNLKTEKIEPSVTPSPQNGSKVGYEYSAFGMCTGKLIIGDLSPLKFKKLPAVIVNYFYLTSKVDPMGYKSYRDFNEFSKQSLTSDEFNKKIEAINARVKKETHGIVQELIMHGETKKPEANIYKWNDTLR